MLRKIQEWLGITPRAEILKLIHDNSVDSAFVANRVSGVESKAKEMVKKGIGDIRALVKSLKDEP